MSVDVCTFLQTSELFTFDTVETTDSQTDERFSTVYELSSVKADDVAWKGIATKNFCIFTLMCD
jgi:hypothetical protein